MAVAYFKCRGSEGLPLFTAPDGVTSVFIHVREWILSPGRLGCVLILIEHYLVNAEGLLFFYWSMILFSSSWALSPVWWKSRNVITGTKISCLLVPALQLGLMRIPAIMNSDVGNLVVMNIISKFSASLH